MPKITYFVDKTSIKLFHSLAITGAIGSFYKLPIALAVIKESDFEVNITVLVDNVQI